MNLSREDAKKETAAYRHAFYNGPTWPADMMKGTPMSMISSRLLDGLQAVQALNIENSCRRIF